MQQTANDITLEQALQNIKAVIELYKGTFQEHFILQESFKLIKEELEKKDTRENA